MTDMEIPQAVIQVRAYRAARDAWHAHYCGEDRTCTPADHCAGAPEQKALRAALAAALPHLLTEVKSRAACPDCSALPGRDHSTACLSNLSEVKSMCETAGRVGHTLGRKEAGDEIALVISQHEDDANRVAHGYPGDSPEANAWSDIATGYMRSAELARNIASQPSGGDSKPRTDPGGHSDLPEDSKPSQEPCEDPACPIVLMHSHPFGDSA